MILNQSDYSLLDTSCTLLISGATQSCITMMITMITHSEYSANTQLILHSQQCDLKWPCKIHEEPLESDDQSGYPIIWHVFPLQNMASGNIKLKKGLVRYFTWPLPVKLLRVTLNNQLILSSDMVTGKHLFGSIKGVLMIPRIPCTDNP